MNLPEEQENDKYNKEMSRRLKLMQQEQQRRELARHLMTNEAYERLMNVRLSNRELYMQLMNLIIQMAQGNRIQGKLTEEQLRSLLARLTSKPEPSISFKHK